MRRSNAWKLAGLGAIVAGAVAITYLPSRQDGEGQIIFAPKMYYAPPSDSYVYVAGTLTGAGVAYDNNTRAVTCYKDRMECLTYSVEQIGRNQIGRLDAPMIYTIRSWNRDEIIAVGEFDCARDTINVERKSETLIWVVEPINKSRAQCNNANDPVRRWTIEDSSAWKAMHAVRAR